jgi:molybdopterin molybdotransferase
LGIAADSEAEVIGRLEEGIAAGADILISSAGVSVGAYDVVRAVLEKEGRIRFWRVRMRPGKPLTFGHFRGLPYLGLPGNPVSATVSFERFARPAILRLSGHERLERPKVRARVTEALRSDGRESYLRAEVVRTEGGYEARLTGLQGSHIMSSLVRANALVIVPEGAAELPAGTELEALMLDWPESVF